MLNKWYCVAKTTEVTITSGLRAVTVTTMEHSTTLARTVTGGVLRRTIQTMPEPQPELQQWQCKQEQQQ